MLDTLTSHREPTNSTLCPTGAWPDPGEFLTEVRIGAREAAAQMKNLPARYATHKTPAVAELRNAIMQLPGNPSRGEPAGLRH